MRSVLGYFRRDGLGYRAYTSQVVSDCLGGDAVAYAEDGFCVAGGSVSFRGKQGHRHGRVQGKLCMCAGELLNAEELCRQYHLSLGSSSSELCLRLHQALGDSFATVLSGPFLIVLYDAGTRELRIYRDQAGQHPLFYSVLSGGQVLFGDDLRTLLRLPGCPQTIDYAGLSDYLSLGYVPAPGTIYRGIRKLRPGCYLHLRRGGHVVVEECYWRPAWGRSGRLSYRDAVAGAREVLTRSVERCRSRHEGCGVLLSGGLDSNVVAALGAGDAHGAVPTYTVGFEDALYDERVLAHESAEALGLENQSAVVAPAAMDLLDELERLSGEPFGDSSLIPTVQAMTLAGRGRWVLTGSGGDEIFGGYRRYQAMCWRSLLRPVPQCLLRMISRLGLGILPRYGETRSRLGTVRRLLKFIGREALSGYGSFQEVFSDDMKAVLLADCRLRDERSYMAEWRRYLDLEGSYDRWLNQFNSLDVAWYLPDDGCRKEWLASRYAGVEKLSPLLDREVMEFGLALPAALRVTRHARKRVLAGVGAELLCQKVTEQRGKRGFGVPVASWFRGPCQEHVRMLCEDVRDWDIYGWFDERTMKRLADEHRAGSADHGARLWNLWCLRAWLRNR